MNRGIVFNNIGGREFDLVHNHYCPSSIPSKRNVNIVICEADVSNKRIRLRVHISESTSIPGKVTDIEK